MSRMVLILFLALLSCEVDESKSVQVKINNTMEEQSNLNDTLSTDELMTLTKLEAIDKFGEPEFNQEFILNELQGEFRVGVVYKFRKKKDKVGQF